MLHNYFKILWDNFNNILNYFKNTNRLLQDYFKTTLRLLQDYFRINLGQILDSLKTSSRLVLEDYFRTASRVFWYWLKLSLWQQQDYFMTSPRLLQNYVKTTHYIAITSTCIYTPFSTIAPISNRLNRLNPNYSI